MKKKSLIWSEVAENYCVIKSIKKFKLTKQVTGVAKEVFRVEPLQTHR